MKNIFFLQPKDQQFAQSAGFNYFTSEKRIGGPPLSPLHFGSRDAQNDFVDGFLFSPFQVIDGVLKLNIWESLCLPTPSPPSQSPKTPFGPFGFFLVSKRFPPYLLQFSMELN